LALDDKTIVVPGTDVGRALEESFQAMEKQDRKKVIILITDGEDLEKGGVKIATALAATNVVVFTVGVGTEAGAEIRVWNEQGQQELVRDAKGEVVRSRLDEPTLRAIAQATKGDYQPLGPLGEGLAKVRLAVEAKANLSGAAPLRKLGIDRFHVPIALVLGLLVLESLIGTRRRRGGLVSVFFLTIFSAQSSMAAEGAKPKPASQVVAPTNAIVAKLPPEPETAREFFNAGTRQLHEGKLREAEGFLQGALKLQDENVQAQSLYNLGHVRYAQGAEELKRAPADAATARRVQNAMSHGDQALQQATAALGGSDVQAMVMAYLNGRGARKDLRETIDLVRRALATHAATLLKWQRALGDFKSALELHPNDPDTKRNIEIVEEAIAKLIEKMRQMAELAQLMSQQREAIGEAMKQLRGKIPEPEAPPGEAGDEGDEDDAERPKGPREGKEEGRGREGKEQRRLSPQEAGWLLESFKLGGDRRLPMGQGEEGKPKDRKGNNW
jgi:tetratricopeptide (TPR) repeat protein